MGNNFSTFIAWLEAEAARLEEQEAADNAFQEVIDYGHFRFSERIKNVCIRCGERVNDLNDEALCETCAATVARGYEINRLAGRCRNGAERDGGTLWHARLLDDDGRPHYKAVCGATPGLHSAGWGSYPKKAGVTCERCKAKLQRLGLEVE